jgi:hypothetical protein
MSNIELLKKNKKLEAKSVEIFSLGEKFLMLVTGKA